MKVLVIGEGGATHALVRALFASPGVRDVYCAPGNAGMMRMASLVDLEPAQAGDLAAWAVATGIDLVVTSAAAAPAGLDEALAAQAELPLPRGGKASMPQALLPPPAAVERLADGDWVAGQLRARGVAVAALPEAEAPDRVLACVALAGGQTARSLGLAWVYRRLDAGGRGPLTEGMGATAPPAGLPDATGPWLEEAVVRPLVAALAGEGVPYRGFLSVEALVTPDGRGTPRVLAVRPGLHPMATQAVLPLLKTDLLLLLVDALEGTLGEAEVATTDEAACAVTLISEGYPDVMAYETGYGLLGLEGAPRGVTVFHEATRDPYSARDTLVVPRQKADEGRPGAGSSFLNLFGFGRGRKQRAEAQARRGSGDPFARVITAGGRVLTVVGVAPDPASARTRAYDGAAAITYTGRAFRSDVGEPER
jgi:phosphoribosylamine--glycine ligase